MNDLMCILPFNSVSITATGNIRVCCNSSGAAFEDKIFDISDDQIINNTSIIKIRSDFLNGVKNSNCERCWNIEKNNGHSFRNTANEKFSIKENKVVNFSKNITFDNLQYLDITLGNKCNLACRMCSPYSSSLVSKQWKELGRADNMPDLLDFDQKTRDKIIDIIKRSPNLKEIYMLGGEPLVSDFHDEMIDVLIKTGLSKNIILHYNTNLQIDVERNLKEWSEFNLVDLSVSIDGVDDTYEYIRWPGKWSKLENNLYSLKNYVKSHTNIQANVATTVQNLNIDNIPDLLSKIGTISDNSFNFYFIPVTVFNELDIISKDVLLSSLTELSKFDHCGIHKLPDLKRLINTAIKKSSDLDPSRVMDFFEWQRLYDKLRNQNLFKTKPHFKNLAEKYGVDLW